MKRALRTPATVLALPALVLACGEEPDYTIDDLTAHLESNGIGVEQSLDLAEMGMPSATGGSSYLVTLDDGDDLLVFVADARRAARAMVARSSDSEEAARSMGVGDTDTYSSGTTFGNVAVLFEDGTDPERVEELRAILEQ